jgi:hypothetical protein
VLNSCIQIAAMLQNWMKGMMCAKTCYYVFYLIMWNNYEV